MSRRRLVQVSTVMAAVCLAAFIGCVVVENGGGPPSISFTIGNKTFTFTLDTVGLFDLRSGERQQKAAAVPLFTDAPTDGPRSAAIELDINKVRAIPLGAPKGQGNAQAISGSVEINVRIDAGDSANPCDTGVDIGTYRITIDNGNVSVEQPSLEVPAAVLPFLISGRFTICLEVIATIDVTLTIEELDCIFGPGGDDDGGNANDNDNGGANENENGNDNGAGDDCGIDADCGAGELCEQGVCVPDPGDIGELDCDVPGNLIVNCSFEEGAAFEVIHMLDAGDTSITAWTVTRDQIDIMGVPSNWDAFDGVRLIDLDGSPGVGGIEQTFPTVPGQSYLLTFAMSGNPEGGPSIERLRVEVGDTTMDFSYDTTGLTIFDLGWELESLFFTAEDAQTTIEFYSLSTDGTSIHGPLLDSITVTEDLSGGGGDDSCTSDADCPSGEVCGDDLVCVPGTPGCTSNLDCGPGETCVDGTCVPGPVEGDFMPATISRVGAEHLIAGPLADPTLSLQSPEGYAPGPFGTKSSALSGDGTKVWVALYDQFPNVEGDPQTQLWSVNTDGSGGVRSSLPVEDMRNGMHVATNIDGSVVVTDNPRTTTFYRATPGTGVSELYNYFGIGDARGNMRISDDASQLFYVNFSLGNIAAADISGGPPTPQVVTTLASLVTNGIAGNQTVFELDISSSAARWMVGTRTFDSDLNRNRWPIFIGDGLASPTISMVTTERDDLSFSRFNMTDDGQTIAYCRLTEFNGLIGRCYIQTVGSDARTEIVDEVENVGNLSLSDDGSKAYMSTGVGHGGGQGFIYDVATGERYTGGSQWFADSSTPDFTAVEWSDDGRLFMSAISRGIYVLHDGGVPAGFPMIDRILYRMNDEDCSMTVRVEVDAPLGIDRIFTLPFYQGLEASRGAIPGEDNPLFRDRSGGGVNKSTTFTLVEDGVWEREVFLTNSVGECASSLLNSDFAIRIVLVEETTTRTVFADFVPVE